MDYKIILASGSPRRCDILQNIGMDFTVIKSGADEGVINADNIPVDLYVQELAMLKATDVYRNITVDTDALIIGADTVVAINNKILGKPKDEEDARNMLLMLSGNTHQVYTGICVVRKSDGMSVCESIKTDVTFAKLTDDEINEYIHTKEYIDKAGSYAIQGKGALLIDKFDGDYFNVVGLPVRALIQLMKREFDFKFKIE